MSNVVVSIKYRMVKTNVHGVNITVWFKYKDSPYETGDDFRYTCPILTTEAFDYYNANWRGDFSYSCLVRDLLVKKDIKLAVMFLNSDDELIRECSRFVVKYPEKIVKWK